MDEYGVEVNAGNVSAWSIKRLPFEPQGWQRAFRDDLRAALRSLPASPGWLLSAVYASPDDGVVDLENVLLYNVGQGCVRHLMISGVTCAQRRSPDHLHRVRYTLAAAVEPADPAPPLARLSALWNGRAPTTAGEWWARLRPGTSLASGRAPTCELGRYRLDVEVVGPGVTDGRLSGMLKSLLDGVVASFQAHDGSHRPALKPLIRQLATPQDPWALLVDPSIAVLGVQALVRPYRQALMWNPADDRCDAFTVRVRRGVDWSVTAELSPAADAHG